MPGERPLILAALLNRERALSQIKAAFPSDPSDPNPPIAIDTYKAQQDLIRRHVPDLLVARMKGEAVSTERIKDNKVLLQLVAAIPQDPELVRLIQDVVKETTRHLHDTNTTTVPNLDMAAAERALGYTAMVLYLNLREQQGFQKIEQIDPSILEKVREKLLPEHTDAAWQHATRRFQAASIRHRQHARFSEYANPLLYDLSHAVFLAQGGDPNLSTDQDEHITISIAIYVALVEAQLQGYENSVFAEKPQN